MKQLAIALTITGLVLAASATSPAGQAGQDKKPPDLDPAKIQPGKAGAAPFDMEKLKKILEQMKDGNFEPEDLQKLLEELTGKGGPLDIEKFKAMAQDLTGKGGPLDIEKIKGVAQDLLGKFSPVGRVREAAERTANANNLRQIAIALHMYFDSYKYIPTHAIYSKDGKTPLLSWRVALLPFIEQAALYNEFKLDEPWDSPNNKKLIEKMPGVYAPAGAVKGPGPGLTHCQVFTGRDTPFDGNKKMKIQFPDGTSNTVFFVEAREPVIWTKPDDLVLPPPGGKMPELGGMFPEGMNLVLFDGSVRWVRRDIDPMTLRALITPAGGEPIDFDRIELPLTEPPGAASILKLLDKLPLPGAKKAFEQDAKKVPPAGGVAKFPPGDFTGPKSLGFVAQAVLLEKKEKLDEKDPAYKLDADPQAAAKDVMLGLLGAALDGNPHKVYTLKLNKGDKLIIELKSKDFDAVVVVENSNKKALALNDDDPAGGTLDSKLEWIVPDNGEYRIVATCLNKRTGDFELSVKKAK